MLPTGSPAGLPPPSTSAVTHSSASFVRRMFRLLKPSGNRVILSAQPASKKLVDIVERYSSSSPKLTRMAKLLGRGSPARQPLGADLQRKLGSALATDAQKETIARLQADGGAILKGMYKPAPTVHDPDYPLQASIELLARSDQAICIRLTAELPYLANDVSGRNDFKPLHVFAVVNRDGSADFRTTEDAACSTEMMGKGGVQYLGGASPVHDEVESSVSRESLAQVPLPDDEPPEKAVPGAYRLELPAPTAEPDGRPLQLDSGYSFDLLPVYGGREPEWAVEHVVLPGADRELPPAPHGDRKEPVRQTASEPVHDRYRPGSRFQYSLPAGKLDRHVRYGPPQPSAKLDPREPLDSARRPVQQKSTEAIDKLGADMESGRTDWISLSNRAGRILSQSRALLDRAGQTTEPSFGKDETNRQLLVSAKDEVKTRQMQLMWAVSSPDRSAEAIQTLIDTSKHLEVANGLLKRALEARSTGPGQ